MRCELCHREMDSLTVHHLVPKQQDGHDGPKAELCRGCHSQVHALFPNPVLAAEYDSLEKLRREPRMQKYIRWAMKQPPNKKIRVRKQRRGRR